MTDRQAKQKALKIVRRPKHYGTKAPPWLLEKYGLKTQRDWHKRKRKELRLLLKTAYLYLMGAAYTPVSNKENPEQCIGCVVSAIQKMQKECSVREWGR